MLPSHRVGIALAVAAVIAVLSGAARAEPDPDGSGAPAVPPASDVGSQAPAEPPDEPANVSTRRAKLAVGGRVFARFVTSHVHLGGAPWPRTLDVSSARLKADWDSANRRIKIGLEFEFSGNRARLRDVYLRAKVSDAVRVDVGNFKRPMSPIALESAWRLPMIERGVVSEDLVNPTGTSPLSLGGRSVGAMARYRAKGGVKPTVYLGVFNSVLPERDDGEELFAPSDAVLRDVFARAELSPTGDLDIGASVAAVQRLRTVGELRTVPIASVDAVYRSKPIRLWLELFAGKSTFFDGTESNGNMFAARFLVSHRVRINRPWLRRLEPFAVISVLDPSDKQSDNRVLELATGTVVELDKALRLQLEYRFFDYDSSHPSPALSFVNTSRISVQLGASF